MASTRVSSSSIKPFKPEHTVGVYLNSHRSHSGLLYRDAFDLQPAKPKLLHFVSTGIVDCQPTDCGCVYEWVDLNLSDIRKRTIAIFCKLISDNSRGNRVPYAFSDPRNCFDSQTGEFRFGSKVGLTCSSFVLSVLFGVGVNILDYDSWPYRPEDEKDRDTVIQFLKLNGVDPDEIIEIEAEIKSARFKPIEVATAAALSPPAVVFNDCVKSVSVVFS